jgi:hypothetical protein
MAFIAGNYLGVVGTVFGLVIGSIISGTAAFFFERFQRRAAKLAKMKAAAIRRKGSDLNLEETAHIQAIVDHDVFGPQKDRWRKAAQVIGLSVAVALVFGAVFVVVASLTSKAISGTAPLVQPPSPQPTVTVTTSHPVVTPTTIITTVPSSPHVHTHIPVPAPTPDPTVTPASIPPASPSTSLAPSQTPSNSQK